MDKAYGWGVGETKYLTETEEMTKATYATELGKCYAKTSDGHIRAYKDGALFRLYVVSRELIWNDDNTDFTFSNRLEAVATDIHIRDIDNFEMAVYELQCELNSLAKVGA
jgi:hypothetical protein